MPLFARLGRRVVAAALLTAACSVARPPAPAPEPVERKGVTGVRVLAHPDAGASEPEGEVLDATPAYASEDNALPGYPAGALADACPDASVAIRVTVSTQGDATLLREVPGRPVPEDACHRAFWEATLAAVRGWKFAPAYRQTPRDGPDGDGDGRPDYRWMDQEPIAIYLDFEFSFRIVEGRGEVGSGVGQEPGA